MNEVKIINDTYKLVKWFLPLIAKYPRNYRYSLGMRTENSLYELLERLQEGYMTADKVRVLSTASITLEHIRLLTRMSFELHMYDAKIHHAIVEQIDNIGKQLGGWIRSLGKPS